jgi:hypothetical protein
MVNVTYINALCAAAAAAAAEHGRQLALAQYFSKELSPHGKGALALLWFGNQVRTHLFMNTAATQITV